MAERTDTSRIIVEVDNKQAISALGKQEAKYSELNAELKDLSRDVKAYNKALKTINTKNIDKSSKAYQNAQKRVQELKGSVDRYNATKGELDKLTMSIDKQRASLGLQGQTLNQLVRRQRQLRSAIKNSTTQGTEGYKKMTKELQELNAEVAKQNRNLKATGEQTKGIGNVNRSFGGLKSTLGDIVGVGGKGGLYGLMAAGIALVVKEGLALEKQWTNMRREVARLSDTSGESLAEVTVQVKALAQTFDQDFNEVLNAANALSKQMNIEFGEALNLIEKGFIQGANTSGDFLSNIKEYPIQFKQAGLSAEQFIKAAIQQGIGGDFDDKLLDSVKEINLRLKEMTPAARKALEPLGAKFVNKITKELQTGSKDIITVFNSIIERANQLGLDAQQTQTLIADLGGGPLEDLGGLQQAFESLDSAMQLNIDTTDGLGEAQLRALDIQKEFQGELEVLTRSLEGTGESIKNLATEYAAFSLKNINSIISATSKLITGQDATLTSQQKLIEQLPKLRKEYDEIAEAIQKEEQLQANLGTKEGLRAEASIARLKRLQQQQSENFKQLSAAEEANTKFNESQKAAIADTIEGNSIRITQAETIAKKQESEIERNQRLREQQKARSEALKAEIARIKELNELASQVGITETAQAGGFSAEELSQMEREKEETARMKMEREARLNIVREYRQQLQNDAIANATTEAERISLQRDLELEQTKSHYDSLLQIAQTYGLDTSELTMAREQAIAKIVQDSNEAQQAEEDRIFAAKIASARAFSSSLGDILSGLNELGLKNTDFQKSLGLTQIAIDSGIAIAGAIRAASTSAGNPIQLITTIAASIGTVLSNIGRAKKILESSKTPAAPTYAQGGLAKGPRHSQGGIPGWVKGIGAIEFEGGEYITNRAATKRNYDIISVINKDAGRTRFNIVPQYKNGGSVIPNAANQIRRTNYQEGGIVAPSPSASGQEGISQEQSRVTQTADQSLEVLEQILTVVSQWPTVLRAQISQEDVFDTIDEKAEQDQIASDVDL